MFKGIAVNVSNLSVADQDRLHQKLVRENHTRFEKMEREGKTVIPCAIGDEDLISSLQNEGWNVSGDEMSPMEEVNFKR